MKEITNQNVSTKIVQPFYSSGTVPVADSNQVLGATKQVDTYDDMLAIPEWDLREGTIIYCKEGDENGNYYFQYNAKGQFEVFTTSSKVITKNVIGYPVLDQDAIDKATTDIPDDYIQIPNRDTDGTKKVTKNTYTTNINGNVIDILFNTVAALQQEITKIKNTFNYGMEVYSGTETVSGHIISETEAEEEPLWAIDKTGLTSQFAIPITSEHTLTPVSRVDYSSGEYLSIQSTVTYTPSASIKNITDTKLFVYITSDSKDIRINLVDSNSNVITLDIASIEMGISTAYNIQVVISREITSVQTVGLNFIWVYITSNEGDTLFKGYYDGTSYHSTRYLLDTKYTLDSIEFDKMTLYDLEICSSTDTSNSTPEPSIPDRSENKYAVAYITQRIVENMEQFNQIFPYIPDATFVWVEDTSSLYFICNRQKYKINGTSSSSTDEPTDNTMTIYELLSNLQSSGIITVDSLTENEDGTASYNNISINDIAQVKFINESTKETYIFRVNSQGELESTKETQDAEDAETIMAKYHKTLSFEATAERPNYRGFIPNYIRNFTENNDAKLASDRLKIGAFYAPLESDTVFGCTHAFVELENTSDQDYNLENYILHYAGPIIGTDTSGNTIVTQAVYHLALKGTIPAGGTYLVRGKRYTQDNLPQTFIKVNTYDIEWYACDNGTDWFTDGKSCGITYDAVSGYTYNLNMLIDFTYHATSTANPIVYGFALTYKKPDLTYNTQLVLTSGSTLQLLPYTVDCINLYNASDKSSYYWTYTSGVTPSIHSNTIYKNTFELDPAKQAFQAFTTKDSSRLRAQSDDDNMYLNLDKQYIQFPHSSEVYDVTHFTPKASFEHKNVCTDKSQLDTEKPNMPTVSFGINIYTTRCFNWVSTGTYDEYVFLRKKGDTTWLRFESYTKKSYSGYNAFATNTAYSVGDQVYYNDCLLQCTVAHTSGTLPDYGSWTSIKENIEESDAYPHRKEFSTKVNNAVYSRIINTLPASEILYTSHKCIVDVVENTVTEPVVYEWCVGRSDYDNTPLEGHVSDILEFTLYPDTYKPVIYQTTDQQGFHWVEYQVWAAAAIKIAERIANDQSSQNIIPICVNTGDMTQNGTRINEWLDYYKASLPLSNHLEQMYVVGNNDLGNPNPNSLGTGDDDGKSNPYFYNLCYCYEIPDDEYAPVFTGTDGVTRYIPSLYYFKSSTYKFIMVNSEITQVTDTQTYKTPVNNNKVTDLYTGLPTTGGDASATYTNPNIPGEHYIYEILYNWTSETGCTYIMACHEMPFTVVTKDNLKTGTIWADRSLNASNGNLIGSHMNRPYSNGTELKICRSKGFYWFSRLLEYRGINYCIGGHKHTYAMTWPVRENYYYKDSSSDATWKSSATDGPMTMGSTLSNDLVNFITYNGEPVTQDSDITIGSTGYSQDNFVNLTKQPLIKASLVTSYIEGNDSYGNTTDSSSDMYASYTSDSYSNASYVVYLMCQATGFKLKSNKELPGNYQRFSAIIPKTNNSGSSDKPDAQQQSPMYITVDCDTIPAFELIKLWNINNGSTTFTNSSLKATFKFTQQSYSTNAIQEYYYSCTGYPTGTWVSNETQLNLNL